MWLVAASPLTTTFTGEGPAAVFIAADHFTAIGSVTGNVFAVSHRDLLARPTWQAVVELTNRLGVRRTAKKPARIYRILSFVWQPPPRRVITHGADLFAPVAQAASDA